MALPVITRAASRAKETSDDDSMIDSGRSRLGDAHNDADVDVSPDIRHDRQGQKFSAVVDGHEGFVEYQLRDGVMTIIHTVVPEAIGGRGLAGQLNAAAVDYAKHHGLKVSAQCSYTAAWLQRRPELADLIA